MKATKLILAGAILTTMAMAEVKVDNKDFTEMKTKCTTVVKTALTCMEKATKPMEVRICKMEMKQTFMGMKIDMMKSGKMDKMHGKGMAKGMAKGKCGQGKCGGAK